jgi:hypothetical protein
MKTEDFVQRFDRIRSLFDAEKLGVCDCLGGSFLAVTKAERFSEKLISRSLVLQLSMLSPITASAKFRIGPLFNRDCQ